jgi:hypothetical protein
MRRDYPLLAEIERIIRECGARQDERALATLAELGRCLDGASAYWLDRLREIDRARMRRKLRLVEGGKS